MGISDDAKALYELVLQVANHFLRNAKQFELTALRGFNPSFEELAQVMELLGKIIHDLVIETDSHLAAQCADYVYITSKMAIAIRDGDNVALATYTEQLNKKPFVMPQ